MIGENIAQAREKISRALRRRTAEKITGNDIAIVAVTKTYPVAAVKEALKAGITVFGENKVQEAAGKIPCVNGCAWHLIGHLQTNKVKKAVNLFDLICSVDSPRLLAAIEREAAERGKRQDVLLQVNVAEEESKFGISSANLPDMAKQAKTFSHVRLRGLMVIAPETGDAESVRPVFKKGYELFCALKNSWAANNDIDTLSMGMSGDFAVAVEEGANNVRLGTLIFGKRDYL
ncbi:MAG: YggS family pyridoxal phosphate-dependent enzyme [Acidaminococcales bacterium]|nr:YggS family pyridoxal phosphate-dependent enzyme [Acidaminococcales bacterium]